MIIPTVGRMVWGYNLRGETMDGIQPFSCQITYVWNDEMVNVAYYDHNGYHFQSTSVRLKQENDGKPDSHDGSGAYVTWMPYQVGQSKLQPPA